MPTSPSSPALEEDPEQLDEAMPDLESAEYARSRKPEDLMAEAASAKHQFTHFPKNPFCRTCQRARMMAPQARSKGGQKRVVTETFGDHIIGDHVIIRKNVEEGFRGEQAPKPDRLEDQVIPPTPNAVPLESEMQAPVDDALEYSPCTPIEAAGDGEPAEPAEPIFDDIRLTPKGEVIPDGHHWDGHRIVRNYKGSKRPAGIDSTLWKMLGSNERQQIIAEEEPKQKPKQKLRGAQVVRHQQCQKLH
eukprot:s1104_g6.t1